MRPPNEKVTDNDTMFFCDSELIWNSDFDAQDMTGDENTEFTLVTNYTCPKCGAEYEVWIK